jgi:hypothetical protein
MFRLPYVGVSFMDMIKAKNAFLNMDYDVITTLCAKLHEPFKV